MSQLPTTLSQAGGASAVGGPGFTADYLMGPQSRNYLSMLNTLVAPLSQGQQQAGGLAGMYGGGAGGLFGLGIPEIANLMYGGGGNIFGQQPQLAQLLPGYNAALSTLGGTAGGQYAGISAPTFQNLMSGNLGAFGAPGATASDILGGGLPQALQQLLSGQFGTLGPAGSTLTGMAGGQLPGIPGQTLSNLLGGNLAGLGPSGSAIQNIIQGKFPGLQQNVGDIMSQLQQQLWQGAQPGLEQAQQQIGSQATAMGQRGLSTPAASDISNLFQNTLQNISQQVLGAGIGQYGQNLSAMQNAAQNLLNQTLGTAAGAYQQQGGIAENIMNQIMGGRLQQFGTQAGMAQNLLGQMPGMAEYLSTQQQQAARDLLSPVTQAAQTGYQTGTGLQNAMLQMAMGMPSSAISALTSTGGLEQSTAQKALDALYGQYTGQGTLQQQNLQQMMSDILSGISVPGAYTPYQQPSGLSQLIGGASSLAPLFMGGGAGGLLSLFGRGGSAPGSPWSNPLGNIVG
jgi:hypothetical protein